MWSRRERTLIGFLVAPAVPGFVLMILIAIFGNSGEAGGVFIFGAMIAYPTTLILGVPAFVALRFLKLDGLGVYLLAGAAMGSTVYVLLEPSDLLATLSRSIF